MVLQVGQGKSPGKLTPSLPCQISETVHVCFTIFATNGPWNRVICPILFVFNFWSLTFSRLKSITIVKIILYLSCFFQWKELLHAFKINLLKIKHCLIKNCLTSKFSGIQCSFENMYNFNFLLSIISKHVLCGTR